MVGCNYDAWFTTPKIWFENARTPDEYGADSPSQRGSNNRTVLNQGMNEVVWPFPDWLPTTLLRKTHSETGLLLPMKLPI